MNKVRLFKRNANNDILVWEAEHDDNAIYITHGLYNGSKIRDVIIPTKKKVSEFESRVNEKRKQGYKAITDLYDNSPESFKFSADEYQYLKNYLPKYNTTSEGFVLPMLAKTLENDKPFSNGSLIGQWKINGLRCIVGAKDSNDIFKPIRFTYHSREGVDWTPNMSWFDELLSKHINLELLEIMIELGACLDGELYLPGYSVNEINSFVKNTKIPQHYLLQYWIYDVCIEDVSAFRRTRLLNEGIGGGFCDFILSKNDHIRNEQQIILLPNHDISNIVEATDYRDIFIRMGFEGLILRNPNADYAFGKRNSSMFKYKKKEDGLFEVIDIKPDKRGLPIVTLKNDINDELFECTINVPQTVQKLVLTLKHTYIGKLALVEFRERSGVKQVPFHAKIVKLND